MQQKQTTIKHERDVMLVPRSIHHNVNTQLVPLSSTLLGSRIELVSTANFIRCLKAKVRMRRRQPGIRVRSVEALKKKMDNIFFAIIVVNMSEFAGIFFLRVLGFL